MTPARSPALFNPRIHPAGLSDADLETLQLFGVRGVVAVADASAPATADGLLAHFDRLCGPELTRLERAGLKVGLALGVHPRCVPRRGLSQVLDALPGYLSQRGVVALGQLGLLTGSALELEALQAQLALAHQFRRPALVSAPLEDTERVTKKILTALQQCELPRNRILLDGAVPKTVRGIVALGFWAGLTVHPAQLEVDRAVALVRALGATRLVLDDAAGLGSSDILSLGRAAHRLKKAGLSQRIIRLVTHDHASALFRV